MARPDPTSSLDQMLSNLGDEEPDDVLATEDDDLFPDHLPDRNRRQDACLRRHGTDDAGKQGQEKRGLERDDRETIDRSAHRMTMRPVALPEC